MLTLQLTPFSVTLCLVNIPPVFLLIVLRGCPVSLVLSLVCESWFIRVSNVAVDALDLFYRFLWRRGFLCFLRRSMFFRGLQVLRRMVCFTECMVLVNDRVLKNRSTSLWGVIHWFSCRIEGVLIQYIYVDKLIVMRKQAALKLRQMIWESSISTDTYIVIPESCSNNDKLNYFKEFSLLKLDSL